MLRFFSGLPLLLFRVLNKDIHIRFKYVFLILKHPGLSGTWMNSSPLKTIQNQLLNDTILRFWWNVLLLIFWTPELRKRYAWKCIELHRNSSLNSCSSRKMQSRLCGYCPETLGVRRHIKLILIIIVSKYVHTHTCTNILLHVYLHWVFVNGVDVSIVKSFRMEEIGCLQNILWRTSIPYTEVDQPGSISAKFWGRKVWEKPFLASSDLRLLHQ